MQVLATPLTIRVLGPFYFIGAKMFERISKMYLKRGLGVGWGEVEGEQREQILSQSEHQGHIQRERTHIVKEERNGQILSKLFVMYNLRLKNMS